MVQTPAQHQSETLLLELPRTLTLQVSLEQFAALGSFGKSYPRVGGRGITGF